MFYIYTYNKSVKKLCLYIEYIKKIIIGWGLETVMEHKSKKKILSVCLYVCMSVCLYTLIFRTTERISMIFSLLCQY